PDELRAGDRLRLRVEDVGQQIVLRTLEAPAAQQQAAPPPGLALPLPGGHRAEVRVTDAADEVRGAPEERVRGAAEELRRALGEATGLPATVRVVGRAPKPRVDLYA